MKKVTMSALEAQFTVTEWSCGQSYKNGKMVVLLPKHIEALKSGESYAVQVAPIALADNGSRSRTVHHLLIAQPDPNAKFVWFSHAGSSEAWALKWEAAYDVSGRNFNSTERCGFFIKKAEIVPVANFKAVEADYFASEKNNARRIEFECELNRYSWNSKFEIGSTFQFQNQQTADIEAKLESVHSSLEDIEITVQDDMVIIYGYIKYSFIVEIPFANPYRFSVERFREIGSIDKKRFEKMTAFKVKAKHTERLQEDSYTVPFMFSFPESVALKQILFTWQFAGQGGHKYARHTTCQFRNENGDLFKLDSDKKILSYPNFVLAKNNGECLLPKGIEVVTGKEIEDEIEAQKVKGRISELPADWIEVKFQNGSGTRRQGAKYLLISDGNDIFVFGGKNKGVLPEDGLFAVVETVENYHGTCFTLKLSLDTMTAVTYADDLKSNGFDFNEETGAWTVEDCTPQLVDFFRLESKVDSDPLNLQGKTLFVPKNWGYIKGELLSGGSLQVEYYGGRDRGTYNFRYYSGTKGDLPEPRASVMFWEIKIEELKKLQKEALETLTVFE